MWLEQLQVHARHPLLEIMPVQKFLKLVEARECGHEVQRLAASRCRPRPHTYALEKKCESSTPINASRHALKHYCSREAFDLQP